MIGSDGRIHKDRRGRYPWPEPFWRLAAALWRLAAGLGDSMTAPALSPRMQDPVHLIEAACAQAVGSAVWGLGQPRPATAQVILELPAEPAYDALSPEEIQDVARRAALAALVDRFGLGADRCGLAVLQQRGPQGLQIPRARLSLQAAAPEHSSPIKRVLIGIEYLDSRRYPWQEVSREKLDRITIGTDPSNKICLLREAAKGVSQFHCWAGVESGRLVVHDGRVIEDRSGPDGPVVSRPGSLNGTAVDGRLLPNPREAAEWRQGGKLVLAPVDHRPDRPANTPEGKGVTLWLLELELNEEGLQGAA